MKLTPEEKAVRDAWLAELWPTCREVSREERDAERALARISPQFPEPVDKPVENGRKVAS